MPLVLPFWLTLARGASPRGASFVLRRRRGAQTSDRNPDGRQRRLFIESSVTPRMDAVEGLRVPSAFGDSILQRTRGSIHTAHIALQVAQSFCRLARNISGLRRRAMSAKSVTRLSEAEEIAHVGVQPAALEHREIDEQRRVGACGVSAGRRSRRLRGARRPTASTCSRPRVDGAHELEAVLDRAEHASAGAGTARTCGRTSIIRDVDERVRRSLARGA